MREGERLERVQMSAEAEYMDAYLDATAAARFVDLAHQHYQHYQHYQHCSVSPRHLSTVVRRPSLSNPF